MILVLAIFIVIAPVLWSAWAIAGDFGWGNTLSLLAVLAVRLVWYAAIGYVIYRIVTGLS